MWGGIIPFPGDLHFNMHTGLGIMRAGEEYLLLIAELLGYKYIKVDFELDHWSHHDSFLLMVAEAAVRWLYSLLPKSHDGRHCKGGGPNSTPHSCKSLPCEKSQ